MEHISASQAFATLGHPGRLAVFRLILRFAPRGVRPTEMAAALGLKQNTLSHHLADLTGSGLVRAERAGRSLYYAADLDKTEGLIGYLAFDVGRGRPDLLSPVLSPDKEGPAMPAAGFNVLFMNTQLNPFALEVLARNGHDLAGLRSKHISEFRQPQSPGMDFVFTVCDTAAAEECPPWPGQPITGHWGLPDPVKAEGNDAEKALVFAQTYAALRRRIAAFVELPFDTLNRLTLQARIDRIGADAAAPDKG